MATDSFCCISRSDSGNRSDTHLGTTTADNAIPARRPRAPRRNISPANGRALEILGHAIEYLTDEYALSALQAGVLESGDPCIEAVQTLMALNRQIYYACPEVEPALRRIARRIFRVPAIPGTDAQSKQPLG